MSAVRTVASLLGEFRAEGFEELIEAVNFEVGAGSDRPAEERARGKLIELCVVALVEGCNRVAEVDQIVSREASVPIAVEAAGIAAATIVIQAYDPVALRPGAKGRNILGRLMRDAFGQALDIYLKEMAAV